MKIFCILIFLLSFAFADTGFSYWWLSDGKIDNQQKTELDALESDAELWCALAELFVGEDDAKETGCVHNSEVISESSAARPKKQKKIWNVHLRNGAYIDSSGKLSNKFAGASARVNKFSASGQVKESGEMRGFGAYKHKYVYAKAGTLQGKNLGILGEFNIEDLKLGGEWLFRRDSIYIFGKYNKNFFDKLFFANGNFRLSEENLFANSSQGIRIENWNFKISEIASVKNNRDSIYFLFAAKRNRKGAGLSFDWNKKRMGISAGFKPAINGTDSLWSRAEYPLKTKIGWDKKMQNLKFSNSFGNNQLRSESKITLPISLSPSLTFRWTANIYKSGKINLRQFYLECGFSM
ncbi:hypothetical protein AGMMS49938_13820 [Fibrobacterales bacterium]|nr:hypothetical protein AGMMS49938_13820 [Fibrobacterales bacterium]